jgi:hypothetical protein
MSEPDDDTIRSARSRAGASADETPDDETVVSRRRAAPDDETVVSRRRAAPDDETVVSRRRAAPDDETVISHRRAAVPAALPDDTAPDTAPDDTVVSVRRGVADDTVISARRGASASTVPAPMRRKPPAAAEERTEGLRRAELPDAGALRKRYAPRHADPVRIARPEPQQAPSGGPVIDHDEARRARRVRVRRHMVVGVLVGAGVLLAALAVLALLQM